MVKVTDTVLISTNSSVVGQNFHATTAGLPFSIAVTYGLLFVIAFGSYTLLWKNAPAITPDSGSYLRTAQDFSDLHIDQIQLRFPGYPVLLLLTGSSQSPKRTLFFVSLLLHFVSVWLLAGLLYHAGVGKLMLLMFAFILLLPPYVESAAYVLTENLSEVMLVTGFVTVIYWTLSEKVIWIILSSLTFGYAALTHPIYQLLPLAIAGYFLTVSFLFHWTPMKWRDAIKGSLILICGSIVLLGAYSYVNYRSVGYFGLTVPSLGQHLSQKTFRVLERLPDEYALVRETLIKGRNFQVTTAPDHLAYDYIFATLPELSKVTGLSKVELSDYLLRINLLLIRKAPLQYLEEVLWSFSSYWFPSSGELANFGSRIVQLSWAVIHFLLIGGFFFNMVLLVGAAIYITMCMRIASLGNRQPLGQMRPIQFQAFMYSLAGTIVLYSVAVTCLIQIGQPRYRVPTDALIVFMFFVGTHLWWRLVGLSKIVLEPKQG